MRILAVTAEMFPFVKTGGLADAAGALPEALERQGADVRTLLPLYRRLTPLVRGQKPCLVANILEQPVSLYSVVSDGHKLLLLEAASLFDRDGHPYGVKGKPFADNDLRFAVLSKVAAEIALGAIDGWKPDVVHVHDWHTALTCVYLADSTPAVASVLTLHNLAFQGQYPLERAGMLGLPPHLCTVDCLEYYGDMSFLKGGLTTASAVTTVSPTYAREILTPEMGMGMHGVLARRRDDLRGIVNGVDQDVWNPATDSYILANFTAATATRRSLNKYALLRALGLAPTQGPVFGVVSRLTWQKGIDLLPQVVSLIIAQKGRLIIHGEGDTALEDSLRALAQRYPELVCVHIGYDERLAHMIQAGSDFIIQPSRFEPCGLTQLYALRYGALPIVSRTGGLAETIIDANDAAIEAGVATGFQFEPGNEDDLRAALDRAINAYNDRELFRRLQTQAMQANFSWDKSAAQYMALFESLVRDSKRGTDVVADIRPETFAKRRADRRQATAGSSTGLATDNGRLW
ncbi:starch synthase [Agrobacterium tumefaciens]|uniref:Glycogen synthase n=1 Tax=Agrobacterium radiobacter TaxID=362 RepID=A0ABR6JBW7_AGRRD|nr:glycogen synthase GlgA [Agrobacterium radiobacter]MBB4320700.1 starch synthase [Agrobacterium radiobacter]MBB4337364.1 starch synthase [Agrobacterium radiobacter]MBB4492387.1 starch synthase [Agrobacterium radiobacter]MBB4497286.1 starch synthase [Agrobacterium radiobacter]MBB4502804.1 starch synthase [Agrobacterium radiobacter]